MSWILEKKQKKQFNFTEYCVSECSSLITCLAGKAAWIIHAVTLVNTINNCGVTDILTEIKSVSRCLKLRRYQMIYNRW